MMNEKLPAQPPASNTTPPTPLTAGSNIGGILIGGGTVGVTEDSYHYEPSAYVTSTSSSSSAATAKATEATSGLYRYASVGSLGGGVGQVGVPSGLGVTGGGPYHINAVPTDFGGTLRSNKGGGGSNGSPRCEKATRKRNGGTDATSSGQHENFCSCFGSSGSGRMEVPFWPALLANIGICALLVGYIFIGSFIFLTIENSGTDDIATGQQQRQQANRDKVVTATATATATATTIQTAATAAALKQQLLVTAEALKSKAKSTAKETTTINDQYTLLSSHKDNATAATLKTTTRTTKTAAQMHPDMLRNTSASLVAAAGEGILVGASAAQLLGVQQQQTETYIVKDKQHWLRQRRNAEQQQNDNDGGSSNSNGNSNKAYDLQTLSVEEMRQYRQQEGDGDVGDTDDVVEDVARQRTVENIWDITVSLNILYKENWTKLAALEIQKFQDQLVKRLAMDLTLSTSTGGSSIGSVGGSTGNTQQSSAGDVGRNSLHQNAKAYNGLHQQHWSHYPQLFGSSRSWYRTAVGKRREQHEFEWNFATAFLYSLTVITTVGYGSIAPRTTLGRMVTIGYATFGIPLTLIYLSSIGGILAKLARFLCTRALCCCFCTRRRNYCCCYSARHVTTKEHELKLKRLRQQQQQESIKIRAQQQQQHLAYCYVRPPATIGEKQHPDVAAEMLDASLDTLSVATTTTASRHTNPFGWSLLAPIALCLLLLLLYITFGAITVAILEQWPLLDGVYFCFMSLTTIGFCDLLPGLNATRDRRSNAVTIWFCAIYILSGLTLTAMCVNVLHEEILLRMRVVVKFKKVAAARETKERTFYGAPP